MTFDNNARPAYYCHGKFKFNFILNLFLILDLKKYLEDVWQYIIVLLKVAKKLVVIKVYLSFCSTLRGKLTTRR